MMIRLTFVVVLMLQHLFHDVPGYLNGLRFLRWFLLFASPVVYDFLLVLLHPHRQDLVQHLPEELPVSPFAIID